MTADMTCPAAILDVPTVGLLTGGFSEAELREAGAEPVFSSLEELRLRLDSTALR